MVMLLAMMMRMMAAAHAGEWRLILATSVSWHSWMIGMIEKLLVMVWMLLLVLMELLVLVVMVVVQMLVVLVRLLVVA